jgi:hypothetical protein
VSSLNDFAPAPPGPEGSGRGSRRRLLAAAFVACALWSAAAFASGARERARLAAKAREFSIDRRRPDEFAAMRLEPAVDGALASVGASALDDAVREVALAEIPAEQRPLWVEAAGQRDEELAAARGFALTALRLRPGWAPHRLLLGELAFASESSGGGEGGDATPRWMVPARGAAAAAPGLEPAWTFLAGASLERWKDLDPEARAELPGALRRAFADAAFVASAFPTAVAVLGRPQTVALLPDERRPLRAAFDVLLASGDVAGAAELAPRIARAARGERDARLRRIRELLRYGDVDGARSACHAWVVDFAPGDFDDEAGRRQSAELLDLWPTGLSGTWQADPRANLVRYFLAGREEAVRGEALLRAIDPMSEVPPVVKARVLLLAGREGEALAAAAEPSEAAGFEWAAFYLDLGRTRLARGDARGARDALARVAPSAREGCDALLLRRDVAADLGDERELALAEEALRSVARRAHAAEAWSPEGSASLCIDPAAGPGRVVRLGLQVASPALVRFYWDGGALPPLLVGAGSRLLRIPMPPGTGRRTLTVESEAGGPLRLGSFSVEPNGPPPAGR